MGEAYLSLGDHWLDVWPGLGLCGVGEQVHDDGTTGDGLVNWEQVLALNPSVLLSFLPGLSSLADTDNDVKALVASVKTLAVALGSVTDHGKSIILEVLKELLSWPVRSLVDD